MEAAPSVAPQCSICLGGGSKPPSQTVVTNCSHRFCKDELVQWLALRGTCPVCRNRLTARDIRLATGAPLDVAVISKPPPPSALESAVVAQERRPLERDELVCLWLTFVLGFFCGFTWLYVRCLARPFDVVPALVSVLSVGGLVTTPGAECAFLGSAT